MLDFFRNQKWLMQTLLALVGFSFIFFGIQGYSRFMEGAEDVAKVDGKGIPKSELDQAMKDMADELRRSNAAVDLKTLETPEFKHMILSRLMRERVLDAVVKNDHYAVSDAKLQQALLENPVIASLRGPDGKLDMERYRQLAATKGLTPEGFEARVRHDIAVQQVGSGVGSSSFVPPSVLDRNTAAYFEQRDIEVLRIEPKKFESQVKINDEDLAAYHKANAQKFQSTEQAEIEYLVLDMDAVRRGLKVSEEDLKHYYEQNISRYTAAQERRASHILITADKGAPPAEWQKAKAKAESVLAEWKASPEATQPARAAARFAELAKKHSQDPGSAARGGDLDFFARGAMVKPFEDAAYAMKEGEVSGLVQSDFGYHIIRLTSVRGGEQKPFAAVRAQIESELLKEKAQRQFAETAEAFSNLVYEQSDSLKGAAQKMNLELKTAKLSSRSPAPDAQGALASSKLLNALFEADSLKTQRNTPAVEIGANQLASARVLKYQAAQTLSLDSVKDEIKAILLKTRSAELAHQEGQAQLASVRVKPETWGALGKAESLTVSRQQSQKQPAALVQAALSADLSKGPALVGVNLQDAGYALIKVNKVLPRADVDAARLQQERQQLARMWASAEGQAYFEALKRRFKAENLLKDKAAQK